MGLSLKSGLAALKKFYNIYHLFLKILLDLIFKNLVLSKHSGFSGCLLMIHLHTLFIQFLEHVLNLTILSEVARIYDTLGFSTPIILFAKQQLWTIKSPWDAAPSQHTQDIWVKFQRELSTLSVLQIPRHLFSPHSVRVKLHGFCDASQLVQLFISA